MSYFESGKATVRVQLVDGGEFSITGNLTIDQITNEVRIVVDSGAIDIQSLPPVILQSVPGLTLSSMPAVNSNETLVQTPLTINQAVVSVTTASTTVLAAAARKHLTIINGGLLPVLIRFGATATTTNSFKLYAGMSYTLPPNFTYTGAITAIMASGTGTLHAVEGT